LLPLYQLEKRREEELEDLVRAADEERALLMFIVQDVWDLNSVLLMKK
jgi:hypothetical protein